MMLTQTKRWWISAVLFLMVLGWGISVHADVPVALKPVLDDQTFMVMHFNVTTGKIDDLADEILNMIQTYVGDAGVAAFQDDLNHLRLKINDELAVFQQAGGHEMYVVWSQYDFPVPFAAVPVVAGAQVEKLIEYLKGSRRHFEGESLRHDLIVAGTPQALARIRQLSPSKELPITKAFANAQVADFEIMLAPQADQRRILAEMLPVIPMASGEIPIQALVDNMQWGRLQLNALPEMSLQVTLESQDITHGQTLQYAIGQTYQVFGQHEKIRSLMPRVDGILARLTPQRRGRRLTLDIDQKQADGMMKDFIAPSLLGIRREAARMACANNLNGLAKAMLIYANDYEDALPLKWDDLKLAEVSENQMVCPAVKVKESYVYRGAGLKIDAPPMTVLIYDRLENHERQGRYVVLNDFSVQWVTEERFRELIEKDNKWRRENDLPEIPPE